MPKTTPVTNTLFNASFEALGWIKSDGHTVLHYNSSATKAFFPGEPVLKKQGTDAVVCLAQSLIKPGEVKSLVRNWEADFPCDFSADVQDGDEIYWDMDNEVASLVGDVTNGFLLGYATFYVEPGEEITAVADDQPVVATSESTRVRVICTGHTTTIIGTVDGDGGSQSDSGS